ncbi:hypothetical protein BC937DRAFT_91291, partial [Endogone sp. FLAS-F59071]
LFLKGRTINVGDEFEFDHNLVTIESFVDVAPDSTQYIKNVNRGNVAGLPQPSKEPTNVRPRWRSVTSDFKAPAQKRAPTNVRGVKRAGEEEGEEVPLYYVPSRPNPASLVDIGDVYKLISRAKRECDMINVLNIMDIFRVQIFPKRRKIGLTRPSLSDASSSASAGWEEDYTPEENVVDYNGTDEAVIAETRETRRVRLQPRYDSWLEYGAPNGTTIQNATTVSDEFYIGLTIPPNITTSNISTVVSPSPTMSSFASFSQTPSSLPQASAPTAAAPGFRVEGLVVVAVLLVTLRLLA